MERPTRVKSSMPIAVLTLMLCASAALAFDINTGNPDLKIRWDNTVKYSLGYRLQDPSEALVNDPPVTINHDDGDRNIQKGIMQNRLDLLSEFDLVYKGWGFRISGAGWYDQVYFEDTDNDSPFTYNAFSVPNTQFTKDTEDLAGRKLELLDAFVFGKFAVGEGTVSFRAGRHTIQWGESLFFGSNGIAGTQQPTDILKLLSVPNAQFKEILRPVNQVSAQWQFTPKFAVGAYYQLEWEANRLPPSGSYFSFLDIVGDGGERLIVGEPGGPFLAPPAFFRQGDWDADDNGQYGAQLKFRAGDWDFGVYYTHYHDKNFQLYLTPGHGLPNFETGQIGTYQFLYPENIDAYGASFSRTFGVWNVAGEVSMRDNAPLVSDAATIVPPFVVGDNDENPQYAVGSSYHANLSWLASFGPSFISKEASFLGEIAWNQRKSIDKGEQYLDPNTDKSAYALRMVYEPMYRQVFPNFDLSIPVGIGYNISGSSSVVGNWAEDTGDYSIGLAGIYNANWRFTLQYAGFLGDAGTFLDIDNHLNMKQTFADRDYVSFSVRTTF